MPYTRSDKSFTVFYRCILDNEIVKQYETNMNKNYETSNASGALAKYLKSKHPEIHEKYIAGKSPYSNMKVVYV